MRIGSGSEYDENALGKYGYGLKGASWSQAKVFTVVTKMCGQATHHLTWDADDMAEWIAKSDPLEAWEQKATAINGPWDGCPLEGYAPAAGDADRRGLDPYSAEIMLLERHLALVFHRFLKGKAAGRKTGCHLDQRNARGAEQPCRASSCLGI